METGLVELVHLICLVQVHAMQCLSSRKMILLIINISSCPFSLVYLACFFIMAIAGKAKRILLLFQLYSSLPVLQSYYISTKHLYSHGNATMLMWVHFLPLQYG